MTTAPASSPPPFDVFLAARFRDLPTLKLAVENLRRLFPVRDIIVAARSGEMSSIRRALGAAAQVRDENQMVPGMTIEQLRRLPLDCFPRSAGWYFQQLLKYSFCFERPEDDFYLIWDADTIPLHRLEFLDPQGRLIFTRSDEYHAAYFEAYARLFGCEPPFESSFISQHMPVRKSRLREMLSRIEEHLPGEGNWAWKIMRSLPAQGRNLFSEYETYGHYMKQWHPDEIVIRSLSWLRDGTGTCGFPPTPKVLAQLAKTYSFAAFESRDHWPIRLKRRLLAAFSGRF